MGNNGVSAMNRVIKYPILKVSKWERGKKEKELAHWLLSLPPSLLLYIKKTITENFLGKRNIPPGLHW